MKTYFNHTLLFLALLAGAFTAKAQVKIGSSPTTIDPNSNLEVQATNGKKVIVHKSDGTVVIENTPLGSITNDILTVDAAGNVLKVNRTSVAPPVYIFEASGTLAGAPEGTTFDLPLGTDVLMKPSSAAADRNNANTWKAPAAGLYRIDLHVEAQSYNNAVGAGIVHTGILKNGGGIGHASATLWSFGPSANGGASTVFQSIVVNLAAGDIIGANEGSCQGCASSWYYGAARLRIERLE